MRYDIVVLGGGSAGLVVSAGGAKLGKKVLLVEKERLGGDCLWTGCVPSKALLHAARVAHTVRHASEIGLPEAAGYPEVIDFAGVIDHVRAIQEGIAVHEDPEAWGKLGVEVRIGSGRFLDSRTFELDGERIEAKAFVVATGSRSAAPPIEGLEEAGYLDHTDLFLRLRETPSRLVVLGGGPIGCEMAQAFRRLGSEVTIIEMAPQLLTREDPDVAAVLERSLRGEGIAVHLGARAGGVRVDGEDKVLLAEGPAGTLEVRGTHILVATGRKPNVEGLGLAAAGVEVGKHGIVVDGRLRSVSNPRVWACGDVAGRYLFTHTAEYEARHVLMNLVVPLPFSFKPSYDPVSWTTFTDPEVARVGLSETEAKASGIRHRVYRFPFAEVDRARAEGTTEGFVKVVASPLRGKVLGAQVVGPHAGELIHEWMLAVREGLSMRRIAGAIHVYPTLARSARKASDLWVREMLPELLDGLRRKIPFLGASNRG